MTKLEKMKTFISENEEKIKKGALLCAAGFLLGSAFQQSRIFYAAKATGKAVLMPNFAPYIDMFGKAIAGATIVSVVATSKIASEGR